MHTCIHAYMHTCIHAYMHTCIHAYMHTHCACAYACMCIRARAPRARTHTCHYIKLSVSSPPLHNMHIFIFMYIFAILHLWQLAKTVSEVLSDRLLVSSCIFFLTFSMVPQMVWSDRLLVSCPKGHSSTAVCARKCARVCARVRVFVRECVRSVRVSALGLQYTDALIPMCTCIRSSRQGSRELYVCVCVCVCVCARARAVVCTFVVVHAHVYVPVRWSRVKRARVTRLPTGSTHKPSTYT